MTFLDLFAGIGGFRLGMEMAGHECVGHCEMDRFAEKSYRAMHEPKKGEWSGGDIRTVGAADLPRADAWCFGFPCQDISVAGKQRGFEGNRSGLFFTVTGLLRAIEKESRPKRLLVENVKNLISVNRGYDFARLLVELDEIGYDAEWDVLNSKNFGVPQNRERVYVVGHLRGRSGGKVFPLTGEGEATSHGQVKQIGNVMPTKTRDNPNQGRVYDTEGIAPCLNGMGGGGREPMIVTDGQMVRKLTPRECFRLQGFPDEYFERAAAVNSDTQLYKQAGNSVTVNVIYEIAKRMECKEETK
ncbi:DNA cytosine methyltransferase [Clostridiales bacterium]|nr:DNA cytosine methyltransferase [Clostridiales bacterium]